MKTLHQAFMDVGAKLPLDDYKINQRFQRAYEIALAVLSKNGGYEISEITTHLYDIHRISTSLFSDNGVHYTVSTTQCTCPDYETARANLCKHRMAVMLVEEMQTA